MCLSNMQCRQHSDSILLTGDRKWDFTILEDFHKEYYVAHYSLHHHFVNSFQTSTHVLHSMRTTLYVAALLGISMNKGGACGVDGV